jgi:hypothetical protein
VHGSITKEPGSITIGLPAFYYGQKKTSRLFNIISSHDMIKAHEDMKPTKSITKIFFKKKIKFLRNTAFPNGHF